MRVSLPSKQCATSGPARPMDLVDRLGQEGRSGGGQVHRGRRDLAQSADMVAADRPGRRRQARVARVQRDIRRPGGLRSGGTARGHGRRVPADRRVFADGPISTSARPRAATGESRVSCRRPSGGRTSWRSSSIDPWPRIRYRSTGFPPSFSHQLAKEWRKRCGCTAW